MDLCISDLCCSKVNCTYNFYYFPIAIRVKWKHLTKVYQFNYFLPQSFSNSKENGNLLWILLKCRFRISRFTERLELLYLIIYFNFFFNWSVKNLPSVQKTWDRSLSWEDPLEKEMTTQSSILAWRIPRTGELGRLQSMGLKELNVTEWVALILTSKYIYIYCKMAPTVSQSSYH